MKWKAILNLVLWLVDKIAVDENGNGIPDILEFRKCVKYDTENGGPRG